MHDLFRTMKHRSNHNFDYNWKFKLHCRDINSLFSWKTHNYYEENARSLLYILNDTIQWRDAFIICVFRRVVFIHDVVKKFIKRIVKHRSICSRKIDCLMNDWQIHSCWIENVNTTAKQMHIRNSNTTYFYLNNLNFQSFYLFKQIKTTFWNKLDWYIVMYVNILMFKNWNFYLKNHC